MLADGPEAQHNGQERPEPLRSARDSWARDHTIPFVAASLLSIALAASPISISSLLLWCASCCVPALASAPSQKTPFGGALAPAISDPYRLTAWNTNPANLTPSPPRPGP
jgi:hypothetical protein